MNKLAGKLYGVGVGSGDPEFVTLKAVRVMREADVLVVPRSGAGELVAYNIACAAAPELAEKELIELDMPMIRDREALNLSHLEAAKKVAEMLNEGRTVAFLTLGDPTVYSTYMYVHKHIVSWGLDTEIIPGITSFCAVAAKLNISLTEGSQPLHIIPGSYAGAEEEIGKEGTRVIMKTGKKIDKVKDILRAKGDYERAQMVERCGMEGERVYPNLDEATEAASYFSIIVVKDGSANGLTE